MRNAICFLLALGLVACSDNSSIEVRREELYAGMVNRVPELRHLLTVDDISEGMKKLRKSYQGVELDTIRPGDGSEPIYVARIGNGARHVLLFAGATGAEPFGSVALAYLIEGFAADARLLEASDITWHIAVCVSPDEALRNEGWYTGPPDVANLTRSLTATLVQEGSGVMTERAFEALQRLVEEQSIDMVIGLRSSLVGKAMVASNQTETDREASVATIFDLQGVAWEQPAIRPYRRDMSALDGSLERYLQAKGDAIPVFEVWLPYFVEQIGAAAEPLVETGEEELAITPYDHNQLIQYLAGASERMAPLITVESIHPAMFETYLNLYREVVAREQGSEFEREVVGAIAIGQLLTILDLEKSRGVIPFPTAAQEEIAQAWTWFDQVTDHMESAHSYTVTSLQSMVQTYLMVAFHMTLED